MPKATTKPDLNGRIIRFMREYAGVSQEALAYHLGVVKFSVYQWESGRRATHGQWVTLAAETCRALCKVHKKAKGKDLPPMDVILKQVG